MQLPVRYEQLAAGAEQLAADGDFGGDDARADGRVGEAQELVIERGEQRAVLEQVRHVEATGGVEGGLDLGLDGAEEGGVVQEVGEALEAEFVGVGVDEADLAVTPRGRQDLSCLALWTGRSTTRPPSAPLVGQGTSRTQLRL